ncbi:MAG TPA: ferritin family protein [Verrucomicrobiae bacterium]|nr:ferritin family protein [Verrucomicrobiae bacterium]
MARNFANLAENEILALAIALEEEDGRIYADFADGLRADFPKAAEMFDRMAEEESRHRHQLIETYRAQFGEHIPLLRRQDVKGFVDRKASWLTRPLRPARVGREAELMEMETRRFYERAAQKVTNASVRQLLGDLATAEREHSQLADSLERDYAKSGAEAGDEQTARRLFVLQVVQPGLAGLMDGSVSTLAPLFAAAFATHKSWDAFLVGIAASIGAGISMGFAEALSDDGSLSGRGRPLVRGSVCGLMTAIGGLGHTLPFLIGSFRTATTVAVAVVLVELGAIAWVRNRYMDTPFLSAAFQVIVGGILVFLAGVLIGSS